MNAKQMISGEGPMVMRVKRAIDELFNGANHQVRTDMDDLPDEMADSLWRQEVAFILGNLTGVVSALSSSQASSKEIKSALSEWFDSYLNRGQTVLWQSLGAGLGTIKDSPRLRPVAELLLAMSELLD